MVARRAHNPEVAGSSPVSATTKKRVETIGFDALFLYLELKWSLFVHSDPKMTPKRKKQLRADC